MLWCDSTTQTRSESAHNSGGRSQTVVVDVKSRNLIRSAEQRFQCCIQGLVLPEEKGANVQTFAPTQKVACDFHSFQVYKPS